MPRLPSTQLHEMSEGLLAACIEHNCVYNPIEAGKLISQAAQAKVWNVVKMGCTFSADLNQYSCYYQTPLCYALDQRFDEMIHLLLNFDASYEKGFHQKASYNKSTAIYEPITEFPPLVAYLFALNKEMLDETVIQTVLRLLFLHPKGAIAALDEAQSIVKNLKNTRWILHFNHQNPSGWENMDRFDTLQSTLENIIPRVNAKRALLIIANEETFNKKTDKECIEKYLIQCVADAKSILELYHLYHVHHDKDYLTRKHLPGYSDRLINFINALRKKVWEFIKDENKNSAAWETAIKHPLFSEVHHKFNVSTEYFKLLHKQVKTLNATQATDVPNLLPPAYARVQLEPTAPDFSLLPEEKKQPHAFFTPPNVGSDPKQDDLGGVAFCTLL